MAGLTTRTAPSLPHAGHKRLSCEPVPLQNAQDTDSAIISTMTDTSIRRLRRAYSGDLFSGQEGTRKYFYQERDDKAKLHLY
jgi:hypothetical protein